MTGLLRTAFLVVFPHGGQRQARANALHALRSARQDAIAQAEAAAAFEPVPRAI